MELNIDADHVFLIVADSLRYDTAASEMSFLDELAAKGVVLKNYYVPGAATPSSMAGIMQSRLPIEHGGSGLSLPSSPTTIAEWLSKSSIAAAGYHSNSYTTAEAGFSRGFDEYHDLAGLNRGSAHENYTERRPRKMFDWRNRARDFVDLLGIRNLAEQAIEPFKRHNFLDSDPRADGSTLFEATKSWLEQQDSDQTFAWLQLMDTHVPYLPPKNFRPSHLSSFAKLYDLWMAMTNSECLSEAEIKHLYELYCAEARYIDSLLVDFVNFLQETGRWESTALIITSDHGELFGDREVPGDVPLKHPSYLCEELTHVPLVIGGGAVKTTAEINHLANGIDIAPTVAMMFDREPSPKWRGETIGSAKFDARDEVISASVHTRENGVTIDSNKLHVAVRTTERALLWWQEGYNAEHYVRTKEGEKLVAEPKDEVYKPLYDIAYEMIDHVDEVDEDGDGGGEVTDRLKNLGYVE